MKILIVGTGAIGTFMGAALEGVGHEVWHLQRPGKKGAPSPVKIAFRDRRKRKFKIRASYYRYHILEEEERVSEFPWILAPVSHNDVRDVAERLAPLMNPQQFIQWMCNIWGDFEWLSQNLKGQFTYAFPHFVGSFEGKALKGWLLPNLSLGEEGGGDSPRLREVSKLWAEAGFKAPIRQDMKSWLLTHFAWHSGIMGGAWEAGGFKKLRWRWGKLKWAFEVSRRGMEMAKQKGARVMDCKEGRRAFQPLWWNAVKMRLVFFIPGVAGIVDRGKEERKWLGYAKTLWGAYPKD